MRHVRTVLLGVLVLGSISPARGQAPAFTLTPPAGSPVSYAAGLALSFSVPVTITQTGNSITITWGAVPPGPTPIPTHPASTIPPNWQGNLFMIAFFDATQVTPPAQLAIQTSGTIGPAIAAVLPSATSKWVATDVGNLTYQTWKPGPGIPIPALVVIATDAAGKSVGFEAIALPATEAAIVAEIKKVRGMP